MTSMIRPQSAALRNTAGFLSALRHAETADSWLERGVSIERPSVAAVAVLMRMPGAVPLAGSGVIEMIELDRRRIALPDSFACLT